MLPALSRLRLGASTGMEAGPTPDGNPREGDTVVARAHCMICAERLADRRRKVVRLCDQEGRQAHLAHEDCARAIREIDDQTRKLCPQCRTPLRRELQPDTDEARAQLQGMKRALINEVNESMLEDSDEEDFSDEEQEEGGEMSPRSAEMWELDRRWDAADRARSRNIDRNRVSFRFLTDPNAPEGVFDPPSNAVHTTLEFKLQAEEEGDMATGSFYYSLVVFEDQAPALYDEIADTYRRNAFYRGSDVVVTTNRDVRQVLLSRAVLQTESARDLEDQFLWRIHEALRAVARIPEAESPPLTREQLAADWPGPLTGPRAFEGDHDVTVSAEVSMHIYQGMTEHHGRALEVVWSLDSIPLQLTRAVLNSYRRASFESPLWSNLDRALVQMVGQFLWQHGYAHYPGRRDPGTMRGAPRSEPWYIGTRTHLIGVPDVIRITSHMRVEEFADLPVDERSPTRSLERSPIPLPGAEPAVHHGL